MKRIVVAHDGTKAAFRALLAATDLARNFGGRVTVLSVLPEGCFQREAKRKFGQGKCRDVMKGVVDLLRSEGVDGDTIILPGEDPAQTILNHAGSTGADVVVIGARKRQAGRKNCWGSVSSRVASQAPCTVFVV